MVTITDTITGTTAIVDVFDVAETVLAWNGEGPADVVEEVSQAAVELQDNLAGGQPYGDQEQYLAVRVEVTR